MKNKIYTYVKMNNILYKLPYDTQVFLLNLQNSIDEPLYFFGSVTRMDYIRGCDIDAAVFSHNPNSIILQLQYALNVKRSQIKRQVTHVNNRICRGYKINYKNKDKTIKLELVIYDQMYKPELLEHYKKSTNAPIHVCLLLLLLKYLSYCGLLNNDIYYKVKLFIYKYIYVLDSKVVVID